jgi:aryl-alcohol dehydrogenase-like predicted oxidoreductase
MVALGLGTVQFGINYGISNDLGKTTLDEVRQILNIAEINKISVLDTAPAYGNSEDVLGEVLPTNHEFKLITKSHTFKKPFITDSDSEIFKNCFYTSLTRLNQKSIYGIIIHSVEDLFVKGGDKLFGAMLELKREGKVKKIGVSVYTQEEIDRILEKYSIDLIQVPINLLDQRLIQNNYLKKLKSKGVEIHARSIFLQGLLLLPVEDVPEYFTPILPTLNQYHAFLKTHNLSKIHGALLYISQIPEIDVAIIGVNNSKQLISNIFDYNEIARFKSSVDYSPFHVADEKMVNPTFWQN